MRIIQTPLYENDSYLFKKMNFYDTNIMKYIDDKTYLGTKMRAFRDKNINKHEFIQYSDRPSLRNIHNAVDMSGSIYTYACEKRNSISYEQQLYMIREMLNNGSRRGVIRIANDVLDYYNSDKMNIDTSCLNLIVYGKNKVDVIFRASDVKNELFEDFISIYAFFILPIYNHPVDIQYFSVTSQNISSFSDTLFKIQNLGV